MASAAGLQSRQPATERIALTPASVRRATVLATVQGWPVAWREWFEERVAIMVVDGGLSEDEAIWKAYLATLKWPW